MWHDPLGHTFHSVSPEAGGRLLVFDFQGSYTEVPAAYAISLSEAVRGVKRYIETGSPEGPELILESD